MRKLKVLLVLFLFIGVTAMFAANNVQLVSSTGDETILKFNISTYQFKKVMTPRGEAIELIVPKTGRILEQGAPDLPRMAASVIIPDRAKMKVEVIDSKFFEIDNVLIAPSKGNLLRNIDIAKVPYTFGAKYDTNAFYPANLADTRAPYIARDFRGQAIIVHPFAYNPVTRTLRVYNKVVVKVSDTGETGKNIFVRNRPLKSLNSEFRKVYARHFLNFDSIISRYTPLGDAIGNMLIVSYSGFMSNMADFVNWKESIGYSVDLVDYTTIGSAAALKTYVANYYNTNGLTFLLLVGDHAQVPVSSTTAGDSDNNYG
ncbi:MAG: C25 family cysteine peptidase, partial [Candidatus Aminicenantes bacterium]|nr:C25 family cysteine peptidase [Candidatus Aminicenantes bacterium]